MDLPQVGLRDRCWVDENGWYQTVLEVFLVCRNKSPYYVGATAVEREKCSSEKGMTNFSFTWGYWGRFHLGEDFWAESWNVNNRFPGTLGRKEGGRHSRQRGAECAKVGGYKMVFWAHGTRKKCTGKSDRNRLGWGQVLKSCIYN